MSNQHSEMVARHFVEEWKTYDRQIRQAVPYYDQALATMVEVIAATYSKPRLILDLGVGTGNLAGLLLSRFSEARLVGVDMLRDFLDHADRRLEKYASRATLICSDVAEFNFQAGYDVVVSSFMFHHLDDTRKRDLFGRIHESLAPDGCFVNLDFVHSGSVFFGRKFDELRIEHMRAQGVSEDRIDTEYVEHRKLEMPVPLGTQLRWLEDAGFVDSECFWKYLNLAMFGARK